MTAGMLIGEILVAKGYLTQQKLQEALAVKAKPGEGRLLGQILVGRGYITPAQMKVALAGQKTEAAPAGWRARA